MVMKPLLALLVLVGVARAEPEPAHAVALLPLDADAKLELYGQPVASELARALVQGGLDVVVVGPKMAVPEKARLVVDGTIKFGKAGKQLKEFTTVHAMDCRTDNSLLPTEIHGWRVQKLTLHPTMQKTQTSSR